MSFTPCSQAQDSYLRRLILGRYSPQNIKALYGSYISQQEIILNTIQALGAMHSIDTSECGLGFGMIPKDVASDLINRLVNGNHKFVANRHTVCIQNGNVEFAYSLLSHSQYA